MSTLMRILKLVLPLVLVCLIAAACSRDSDDSAPPVAATEAPTLQPAEVPASPPTDIAEELSPEQQELADALFGVILEDEERPSTMAEDQVLCLVHGLAGVFSGERLDELGLSGPSITAAYESANALFGEFAVSDGEMSELVDRALECMDWRGVLAEEIALDGLPSEQARCIATEVSSDVIRAFVSKTLIAGWGEDLQLGGEELMGATQACFDFREMLYETYVDEGLSADSARCVANGLSEELLEMMMGSGPDDEEAVLEMMGELIALQNRCLTPEELESMGGSGFSSDSGAASTFGSGPCPPADGSGPTVLDFDGPQPMCLDATKQYTAVFDTTAGEMRIALDMANTPVTANNFAVLALYHYYDDTLLFRTDPSIGIIQGGAPHTNSPSDPGPGYTIPDEGSGFTYEPGQLVMARTAAPDSASAQFFFAVNEKTALLNSQGTYVVFGQMDDASLAVAEAILASHVDQPDNPLGGGPEPPVTVNSVTIEETG